MKHTHSARPRSQHTRFTARPLLSRGHESPQECRRPRATPTEIPRAVTLAAGLFVFAACGSPDGTPSGDTFAPGVDGTAGSPSATPGGGPVGSGGNDQAVGGEPGSSNPGTATDMGAAGAMTGSATSPSATQGGSTPNAQQGTTSEVTISTPPDPYAGLDCATPNPGRAPLRRLTRFEYNNTVRELLGDDTRPANSLPAELLGNGFGNDADEQPSSSFLVEQYGVIAAQIAERATASTDSMTRLDPCLASASEADENTCARTFLESFLPRAYRRPVESAEIDEMLALQQGYRENESFTGSIADVIETVLQSPDFLYRLEWGAPDSIDPAMLRPTGHEMASRLSYLFWGSMPDDALLAAADAGELATADGVYARAQAMLDDPRSRPVVRFFADHYLPLNGLADLSRDPEQYPTFTPSIGTLMREETQRFLEYEIFEGPGDWRSALTAPYTFVNEELANYYGISGVVGPEFQKVDLDPTKRLGLLTQGSIMTGTTVSNFTNPVRRGGFFLRKILCVHVPDPPEEFEEEIMPPDPYSGDTARERYSAHSEQAQCKGCHAVLDPAGFALENYDAVGQWRDQENGVTIDASGSLSPIGGEFDGPIQLVNMIANANTTMSCFAENWTTYAYGRALDAQDDCTVASVQQAFINSGYDVKELLLALTQTDAFLYLPKQEAIQ